MTTRRLIFLRHAKSAWDTDAPDDHSRPLSDRGHRDAPRVATELAARGWSPQIVVSSDSRRTRETWAGMEPFFDGATVCFSHGLYHGGVGDIQRTARSFESDVGCAMLIGHNPGWEEAVGWLTGTPIRMTTCNAALLQTEADTWAEALDRPWELVDVIRPKAL